MLCLPAQIFFASGGGGNTPPGKGPGSPLSYLAQLAATALSRSSSISSAAPTPPTQSVSPVSPVALAAGTNENAHLLAGELNFIASPSSPLTGSESEGSSPAGQHPIAWLDIDDGTSVPLYRLRRTYAIPRSPISAEERARNEEWFRNRDRQLSPSANSNNTLARAASAASTHGSSGENNPATPAGIMHAAWRQVTQAPLNRHAPRRPLNGSPDGIIEGANVFGLTARNLQQPFARAFQEEAAAAASAAQAVAQAAEQLRSDSQLASVAGQAPASVSPSALEQATQQAAQAEQAVTVLASLANTADASTADASTAGASAASAASSQAQASAAGSLPQKRGRGHDGGEGGDQKRR